MKQRKTLRFLALAGLLLLLTGGLVALAQQGGGGRGYGRGAHGRPGGPGDPGGPGHGMARLADDLDLSEEQRETIRGILESHHSGELGETMTAMRDAREHLRDVVHDNTVTEAQVREAVAPIIALEERMALLQHGMALEIDAVLTEEQRAKAKKLREQRPERRGRGQGFRGKGNPPYPD